MGEIVALILQQKIGDLSYPPGPNMHTASDDWKDPIKDALKDSHRRGKLKSKLHGV